MNFLSFGEVSTTCCHFAVYLQRIPQISTEESFMSTPDLTNPRPVLKMRDWPH